jgi:heme/copper-type cytochrome/quinol oxidase subunit 2
VTLVLHATDVVHGLYLDGYDVNIKAVPGLPAQATFVADRVGKFRYRCSVTCGNLHPFMIGELIVGPNVLFWRTLALAAVSAVGALAFLYIRSREMPQ